MNVDCFMSSGSIVFANDGTIKNLKLSKSHDMSKTAFTSIYMILLKIKVDDI